MSKQAKLYIKVAVLIITMGLTAWGIWPAEKGAELREVTDEVLEAVPDEQDDAQGELPTPVADEAIPGGE